MKNFSIIIFIVILLMPIKILPQTDSLQEYNHDGFFLRVLTGLSSTNWESETDTKTGGALNFSLQTGWGLSRDLAIYGGFGVTSVLVQRFSILDEPGSDDNTHLAVYDFGAGCSYYFMPENIYFSFCALLTWSDYEFNEVRKGESDTGYGLFISAGKEWWSSEDVGLGVALFYSSGNMKDKAESNQQNISTSSIGILFSATLF